RITLLRLIRLRVTSQPHDRRICLPVGLHAYTSTTTHWRGHLPASPHHLATTGSGPTHTHPPPEGLRWVRVVSLTRLARDAHARVREYQPVIHRLRLSASP